MIVQIAQVHVIINQGQLVSARINFRAGGGGGGGGDEKHVIYLEWPNIKLEVRYY